MRSLDFATEWRTGDQSGKSIPRVEWPLLVAVCHKTDCQDNRGLWSRKDLSELRFGELPSPRFELESSNQQGHGQPSCSTRELCHALHSCRRNIRANRELSDRVLVVWEARRGVAGEGRSPRATVLHLHSRMRYPGRCGIPEGFVESGICGLCAFLVFQREPEIIKWLAITRIRIAMRQPDDGTPEELFGILKFAAAQAQQSHSIVTAHVVCIAAEPFLPIRFRETRRMAILFQVQPGQVELLDGRDCCGGRGFRRTLRQGSAPLFLGLESNHFLSVGGKHTEEHICCRAVSRQLECFDEGLTRPNIPSFLQNNAFSRGYDHAKLFNGFGSQHTDFQLTSLDFEVYGGQPIGVFSWSDFLNRIPILLEGACLIRLKP